MLPCSTSIFEALICADMNEDERYFGHSRRTMSLDVAEVRPTGGMLLEGRDGRIERVN